MAALFHLFLQPALEAFPILEDFRAIHFLRADSVHVFLRFLRFFTYFSSGFRDAKELRGQGLRNSDSEIFEGPFPPEFWVVGFTRSQGLVNSRISRHGQRNRKRHLFSEPGWRSKKWDGSVTQDVFTDLIVAGVVSTVVSAADFCAIMRALIDASNLHCG